MQPNRTKNQTNQIVIPIMLQDYFSFQVFLIVLRETLELAIIISVLLSFIHQSFPDQKDISRYLKLQVWIGGLLGLIACLIVGTGILSVFYILGNDLWAVAEHYWEGTFSIVASIIISVMGIKILRVNKMQEKWKRKLTLIIRNNDSLKKATNGDSFSDKYSMFILPFVTTLREGMEAIVFIGGIGVNENTSASSIINSLIAALLIGSLIGVVLYRSGNSLSLQWFLITSTAFLYLVAAGLFSKGVWNFELQQFINNCDGFDPSETGNGPGSYDIFSSVWHVNCCNGELKEDGPWWMIFTAIFGWTNSATYGSVISYNLYWVVVIGVVVWLLYKERKAVESVKADGNARVSLDSITSGTLLLGANNR